MLDNLIEAAGYALMIAFLYFVWPPLALLGAGAYLVVLANVRAARRAGHSGRTAGAIAAAVAAARRAYATHTGPTDQPTGELRRVA
ncbi:MAG TPA: hypothetical protein VF657_22000 [Actinoplanes sp.]